MKKKIAIWAVVIFLVGLAVDKGYRIAHYRAETAMNLVQKNLQAFVGMKGKLFYTDSHVSLFTQSVILHNVRFAMPNGTIITAKRIKIMPIDQKKMAILTANAVHIDYLSLTMDMASLRIDNLKIPFNSDTEIFDGFLLQDISRLSFKKATIQGAFIRGEAGILRLGNWQINHYKLGSKTNQFFDHIEYVRPQSLMGINILRISKMGILGADLASVFVPLNEIKSPVNRDYNLIVQDISFLQNYQPIVKLDKLDIKTVRSEHLNFAGTVQGDHILTYTSSPIIPFREYLQKIGYSQINGNFSFDFTYKNDSRQLDVHQFDIEIKDMLKLGMNIQGQFPDRLIQHHVVALNKWFSFKNLEITSIDVNLHDVGFYKHIFHTRAEQTGETQQQVGQAIQSMLEQSSKGKDFDLDRQFYTALSEVLMQPSRSIQINVSPPTPIKIRDLTTLNFIELFKLANQINMTIKTKNP